jgi:hypothetical protein
MLNIGGEWRLGTSLCYDAQPALCNLHSAPLRQPGGSRDGRRPSEDTKRSGVPQRPLTHRDV